MNLADKAIDAVDDRAEEWAGKLLDKAADAARDKLEGTLRETALSIVLSLRKHEPGIGQAGALGFSRLVTAVAAGEIEEAVLEIDKARTWEERSRARRSARLAAHGERESRDDVLGLLLATLEGAGRALLIALPYLLAPALDELSL